MSLVVHSSVIVAALIDTGPNGIWAEQAIEREELYTPELVRAEVMNILRRLEGAKQITTREVNTAREHLMQLRSSCSHSTPSPIASGSYATR